MRKMMLFACALLLAFGCGARGARSGPDSGEAWLATTMDGRKVGYSVYRFDRDAAGYRFESYVKMTVAMAGRTQRVQLRSVMSTGPDLVLRDFTSTYVTDDNSLSAGGRVEDGELRLRGFGEKSERSLKLAGPVYPAAALGRFVVTRGPSADSVYRLSVFDAAVLGVIQSEVRVLGREKVTVAGVDYQTAKFTTRMAKYDMTSWVDDKGVAIVETSPPGMRSERISPDQAVGSEPAGAGLDVLLMFRVPVDTSIPESKGAPVRWLKLEVSGVDPEVYDLDGPGQRVTGSGPLTVEITAAEPPPGALKLPVAGADEYLKPAMTIECDAPEVKARTAEAIGAETDAVAAARRLVSWVFTSLEKAPTASFPTAVQVARTLKGDCNEHAVLLAAMARAAGIPAKIDVGLIYMNRAFYYHAWNELYLGRWVPVDATFGEFPASALHLKLAEGDLGQQAEILGLVGSIKIKVREFETVRAE
jgi:hypothetical protein